MDLPAEDENWDLSPDSIGSDNPFPRTAYLQAQGAQLLGRVISLILNPPLNIEDRRQEDSNLKTSLVQFAISVTDISRDVWGANCGTLGITYRYGLYDVYHSTPSLSIIYNKIANTPATAQYTSSISLQFPGAEGHVDFYSGSVGSCW
jgi:hypothetical protein